ncbi:MAG: rhomboid family intramembrane serine protease [Chloroherpetonaceae bacterium]|nr:rhomboid family intramembrane serine protease [Chloroherpetonaceae bacterium]
MNLFQAAPAATSIFIANIALSLVAFVGGKLIYEKLWLHPYSIVRRHRYYLLLTSGFIHADFGHLAFNMITFFFFGFPLARQIGDMDFLAVYFGSLILSNIPTVIKEQHNPDYKSIGASGAISGVLFGYILFAPLSKIYVFLIPIGIPAVLFAGLYLAFSYYAAQHNWGNINHEAHFWGALAGTLLTILLEPQALDIFYQTVLGA